MSTLETILHNKARTCIQLVDWVPTARGVRMLVPVNQLFNDESIAVQIIFVELAVDSVEHRIYS